MKSDSRLFELNVSFLLRTSFTNTNGEHPIVLRLKYRWQKKDINTGLSVLSANWIAGALCNVSYKYGYPIGFYVFGYSLNTCSLD